MRYEVELKFRVTDFAPVEAALRQLGATFHPAVRQTDLYFAHPARDFARTDEALRIRRAGPSNFITYKGPKIDATTKTRREIDLPLPPGEQVAEQFAALLAALGFAEVAKVRKLRRRAQAPWQNAKVDVALDDVERLGHFVELELAADDGTVSIARDCLRSLAAALGLSHSERRSYLELLLENHPAKR